MEGLASLWRFWPFLADGLATTLAISAGAWLLSVVGALVLVVASTSDRRGLRTFVWVVVGVLRSVPEIVVLLMLFYAPAAYGLRIPPLAVAVVGLGLVQAGFVSEVMRAALRTVPKGQILAAHSIGLTNPQIVRHVVAPIALRFMIPPLTNVFVSLLKLSSIASVIGAPELLYRGQAIMNQTVDLFSVSLVLVIVYVLITFPITAAARCLERHFSFGQGAPIVSRRGPVRRPRALAT